MRQLQWMVLKRFPGPFLAALGLFMFLILMQFLMQNLPKIVGKGLDPIVMFELIAYSLAYMFTLAVPMSMLVATLITFSKLVETRAWMVIRNAGVSLLQILWPLLVLAGFITAGMWHFAGEVLPEAGFRSSGLWLDIARKKPDFLLEEGKFYNGLQGYTLLVRQKAIWSGELRGVFLFDYTKGNRRQATLIAEKGYLASIGRDLLKLTLVNGELHRNIQGPPIRYERVQFHKYETTFDTSDLMFRRENKEGIRGDRTIAVSRINTIVDSMQAELRRKERDFFHDLQRGVNLNQKVDALATFELQTLLDSVKVADAPTTRRILRGLSPKNKQQVYQKAIQSAQQRVSMISVEQSNFKFQQQRIDEYIVEVYKKRTMAIACFVFVLLGAPLGLIIRRGGLGVVAAIAGILFMLFWFGMVNGEKLADRGFVPPIMMWASTTIMSSLAIFLLLRHQFGHLGIPIRRYLQHIPLPHLPRRKKSPPIPS
ncbi:MAG TPA: LptF/LptG family permease [Rhodothermales bacterium]|nr:LptF/LptG family permease [Rhodothermales bacterium]